MRATVEAMEHVEQPDLCVEQDIRFHRLLAEASGNVLLPLVMEPLDPLVRASRLATIQVPGAIDRSAAAHRAILRQVEDGDVEGARQMMRDHLTQVAGEIGRARRD